LADILNINRMSVTGIILSGGKSSRMGKDKGLLELGGKKLVEIAIGNLSLMCDTILVSSNSDDYSKFGVEVVPDTIPDIGPMGGIYSALLRSDTELNLVLSVDLPFINEGLLRYLVERSLGVQVAVPWSAKEHYEPLCACYNSSLLPLIEKSILQGNYKLPDLFKNISLNPLIINNKLPFYKSNLFYNINTESDLISAKNMMNSSK
jgi:molybdenum cofactor guanylyltransferase